MASSFAAKKSTQLSGCDLSRKGSIDSEAIPIVEALNACPFYCTTSSCAGRVVLYEWNDSNDTARHSCNWLLASHEQISFEALKEALTQSIGDASIRFEPFILHVSCETLKRGRFLHTAALEAGFKNSGLTVAKSGHIMLAIRSTLFLEVPLTLGGRLLVSDEYLNYVIEIINNKFNANSENAAKLLTKIKTLVEQK